MTPAIYDALAKAQQFSMEHGHEIVRLEDSNWITGKAWAALVSPDVANPYLKDHEHPVAGFLDTNWIDTKKTGVCKGNLRHGVAGVSDDETSVIDYGEYLGVSKDDFGATNALLDDLLWANIDEVCFMMKNSIFVGMIRPNGGRAEPVAFVAARRS